MQNNLKIAAVIILYHPPETVVANIKTYYDYVDKIYVFDNTEGASCIKKIAAAFSKIDFFGDGQNHGIAEVLNKAAHLAIEENFGWLLTMDQDTRFPEETIYQYLNCFRTYPHKKNVALFGTAYDNNKREQTGGCTAIEVKNIITSGALLNLSLFKKIGGFDEQLFIDSVDDDYCIRAGLNNFTILKFSTLFMGHQLGTQVHRTSLKTGFLIKKKKTIHSPLRCYYMYRNLLYLEKKYNHADTAPIKELRRLVMRNLKRNLFYGRQALQIGRYLIVAYKDFKKGKMGKH